MAKSLVVVAGTGITLSVVCLSLASLVSPDAGRWLLWPGTGEPGWWGPLSRWEASAPFNDSGDVASREFAWTGGDSVQVDIPGVVHFARAPAWKVTATGRDSALRRLRIDAGRIWLDRAPGSSSIDVLIEGPALNRIVLNGSADLVLEGIAQQELDIVIRGSGSVQGSGSVGTMDLTIVGSGDAELVEVSTGDSHVRIVGSGDAEIAPTGDVEVTTIGSGDVRLSTKPRHLSTRTVGSGSVTQLEVEGAEHPEESTDAGQGED